MPAKSKTGVGRGRGKPFPKGHAGPGRPKGSVNKATAEVKDLAGNLIGDPTYRANLQKRLRKGTCAPAVETMLWHYRYGKPKEMVELTGPDGTPLTGGPPVLFVLGDAATDEDAEVEAPAADANPPGAEPEPEPEEDPP